MIRFESCRSHLPTFTSLVAVVLLGSVPCPALSQEAASAFDEQFHPRTMRVDYFHTGGRGEEIVSLDRIVADGAWAGSLTRLVDETNLGLYLFEVIDPGSNRILYSRGFASIYGEWETTAEARDTY
ncbi:MAG: hypothetical protein KAJ43_06540, partial [Gemmatimonadetes bacterium]|nr:hypothetical protein [Gemmatimonadota bacterium]